MRRAIILALGTVFATAALTLPASLQAATAQSTYKAPVNALGQPDLGEYWTNASMTPESRVGALGGASPGCLAC